MTKFRRYGLGDVLYVYGVQLMLLLIVSTLNSCVKVSDLSERYGFHVLENCLEIYRIGGIESLWTLETLIFIDA